MSCLRKRCYNFARNASKQLNRLIYESIIMRREGEIKEIPADRKVVSTLVIDKNGERQLIMKGNISQIVERCSHIEFHGGIYLSEGRNSF